MIRGEADTAGQGGGKVAPLAIQIPIVKRI